MAKLIGMISTFIVLQMGFVALIMFGTGRWSSSDFAPLIKPFQKELANAPSEAEASDQAADAATELPALLNKQELERRQRDLESAEKLLMSQKDELKKEAARLETLRQKMAGQADDAKRQAKDKAIAELLPLVDALPTKNAKQFLMTLTDDDTAVSLLKKFESTRLGKVSKEFKSAEEQAKLNRWLDLVGQGKPAEIKPDELAKKGVGTEKQ